MDNFARDLNVHPDFFVPFNVRKPADEYYDCAINLVPNIWRIQQDYFWTYVQPREVTNVVQGWKIHVSTTPDNAISTLEKVMDVCVALNTEFKFASDKRVLRQLLSKNCSRSASGKFITIYPANVEVFQDMLERLYLALKDQDGPYILSDRAYKDSKVVYFRYGGFRSFSSTKVNGKKVSYILDDKHNYVEDQRQACFYLPDFTVNDYENIFGSSAPVAKINNKQNADGSGPDVSKSQDTSAFFDGKYEVNAVIKASNAGGVYIANNVFTDENVILKEARPCIGFNSAGSDAMEQLYKEFRILKKIESSGIAAKAFGIFQEWEHIFLAQEKIEGITLRQFQVKTNKIVHSDASTEQIQQWMAKIVQITQEVISNIIKLHEHNVIFGDLSPNNIMINEDTLQTTLIDLEGAYEPGVDKPINIFTPGFGENARMDRDETHFSDDYFALGATLLSMVMPNASLMQLQKDYIDTLFSELSHDIGLPQTYIEVTKLLLAEKKVNLQVCLDKLATINVENMHAFAFETKSRQTDIVQYSRNAVKEILRYNSNTMDTARRERVFPMGPSMSDPLTIDHGVLGVAYVWHSIAGNVPLKLTQWIQKKIEEQRNESLPGLMNGLSGTSWVLASLGLTKESARTLRRAQQHKCLYQKMSLGYGTAGFGLANLHLWTVSKDTTHLDIAIKMADIICESAIEHENGYTWDDVESEEGAGIGLFEGSSGIALFLLYMYCHTKDNRYLAVGEKGLTFDMAHKKDSDGSVGFQRNTNDSIIYPYLAYGSAGIATVALRYYLVTQKAEYLGLVNDVKSGIAQKYTINSGFSNGLVGLGHYMLDVYQFLGDDEYLDMAYNVVSGISMFEVKREEGTAFPDANRSKICTDFYDGSAGVALFLNRLNNQLPNQNFMMDSLLTNYLHKESH